MEKSFIVQCKEFFGLKDGQTLAEFATEVRQLTAEDKAEFVAAFNAMGMPTKS